MKVDSVFWDFLGTEVLGDGFGQQFAHQRLKKTSLQVYEALDSCSWAEVIFNKWAASSPTDVWSLGFLFDWYGKKIIYFHIMNFKNVQPHTLKIECYLRNFSHSLRTLFSRSPPNDKLDFMKNCTAMWVQVFWSFPFQSILFSITIFEPWQFVTLSDRGVTLLHKYVGLCPIIDALFQGRYLFLFIHLLML